MATIYRLCWANPGWYAWISADSAIYRRRRGANMSGDPTRLKSLTAMGGMRVARACGAILILTLLLSACAGGAGAPTTAPTAPPVVLNSGPLKVTLTSPENETVVDTPQVYVTGQAPAE